MIYTFHTLIIPISLTLYRSLNRTEWADVDVWGTPQVNVISSRTQWVGLLIVCDYSIPVESTKIITTQVGIFRISSRNMISLVLYAYGYVYQINDSTSDVHVWCYPQYWQYYRLQPCKQNLTVCFSRGGLICQMLTIMYIYIYIYIAKMINGYFGICDFAWFFLTSRRSNVIKIARMSWINGFIIDQCGISLSFVV